jgi:glycosyltransferase involved in cell wall biosynthesis
MISCLIVNFNCLFHTKNLIKDVEAQDLQDFELIIMDQNSHEEGTKEFLESIKNKYTVIQNGYNKPLNTIWNDFVTMSKYDYCAFLNNDIRIPTNFLSNTVEIFNLEPSVSCVIHPTNHKDWSIAKKKLSYEILSDRTRQGWDHSFRKSDWVTIPSILDFYCGDDFIFENVYLRNKHVAMALSSPIIHLLSQTRKSPLNKVIPNRNPIKDVESYKKLGFRHYLNILDKYSKIEPEIAHIRQES